MSDRRAPTAEYQRQGAVLRELRRKSGRKLWEIAYELGMGEQNLLGYESGRNRLRSEQIRPFAKAYGIEDAHVLFEMLHPIEEEVGSGFELPARASREIGRCVPSRRLSVAIA